MNATTLTDHSRRAARRYELCDAAAKPRTLLEIESRDAHGGHRRQDTIEVLRPAGAERQYQQLVTAVKNMYPDARLCMATDDAVIFVCRSSVIKARYRLPASSVTIS